jgi:hypothetical protein
MVGITELMVLLVLGRGALPEPYPLSGPIHRFGRVRCCDRRDPETSGRVLLRIANVSPEERVDPLRPGALQPIGAFSLLPFVSATIDSPAFIDILQRLICRDVMWAGYGFTINTNPYRNMFKVIFHAYDMAGNVRTTTIRTGHR